jgi:bifunctional non-homologous end joining protein LigD
MSGKSRKVVLSRYQAKRDFTRTPEPSGKERPAKGAKKAARKGLAFCVQKHLASHLHYDFRLEHPETGVLLSWAVPKGPSLNTKDKRLAMRVEDHPFDYRTFEGVIPSGYGAGVVMLWDEGTWEPEPGFEDVAGAIARGELKFRLKGEKLAGGFVLVRTGGSTATGERERWLLMKHRDAEAKEVDVTQTAPTSVKSKRTFEEILKNDPQVWESAGPAARDELEKIVKKVVALGGGAPAGGGKGRTAPPRKGRRT